MKLLVPLGLLLILTGVGVLVFPGSGEHSASALRSLLVEGETWPPVVGERYPDLVLVDRHGSYVPLSSLEGRVILLEPIGMSCPACQAFAGAHQVGSLGGVRPQNGMPSIEEALAKGGIDPRDPGLVRVHLLLFDLKMGVPTPADVGEWADRFVGGEGELALAGATTLQGDAGYNLVPGFQLIDKSFVLRVDSTGHRPRDDLWSELLPRIPTLLAEPAPLSVEEAYRAIPHRRTPFDFDTAAMPDEERAFLLRFFSLTDRATAERVRAFAALERGGVRDDYPLAMSRIVARLESMPVPDRLREAHGLVVEAIRDQMSYFESPGTGKLTAHPKVRSSSAKLRRAYSLILECYGSKAPNRNAFFDHLCALDFI
jgi:hypothetical protein